MAPQTRTARMRRSLRTIRVQSQVAVRGRRSSHLVKSGVLAPAAAYSPHERRPLRDHLYSRDRDYVAKVARSNAAACGGSLAAGGGALFSDEMGYYRRPRPHLRLDAGGTQASSHPAGDKAGATNRQQRLIGALQCARRPGGFRSTNYLVGRRRRSAAFEADAGDQLPCQPPGASCRAGQLVDRDPARRTSVLATLRQLPAAWSASAADLCALAAIRSRSGGTGCAATCGKGHRLADDLVPQLRQHVSAPSVDLVRHGSPGMLRYVGLIGDGHLAYVLCSA